MNHLRSQELHRYLDRTTASDEHSRIEAHLAQCPVCAGELKLLNAIDRAARNAVHVEPSQDFTARVMARVAPAPRFSTLRLLLHNAPAMLMAAAVVVVLVIAFASHDGSSNATVSTGIPRELAHQGSAASHSISTTIIESVHSYSSVLVQFSPFIMIAAFLVVMVIINSLSTGLHVGLKR